MSHLVPIRRALLSVSDKTGLVALGQSLAAHGAELLSTGGTAAALRAGGLAVVDVADHTGFPEILDGRVKTLLPRIHGGLLGRRDRPDHLAQMQAHGIAPIDLAVVNLYPFAAVAASGAAAEDCIENIDIGGPALIRAAAKNHDAVAVLTGPDQYSELIRALAEGGTDLALRRALAGAAFARVAAYDSAIATWFATPSRTDTTTTVPPVPPAVFALAGGLQERLRYGENPHQTAALYVSGEARPGVASARQAQGKALSFNNLADADAALECVAEFDAPAVVIVKHANPCGAATAEAPLAAWQAALAGDPVSAFGGIVALNRPLDEATAAAIAEIFTEVIVAPDATDGALAALARKPALRLLLTGALPDPRAPGWLARSVAGGILVQSRDTGRVEPADLRSVTRRALNAAEMQALLFAWRVCKHVKSNAITLARAPGHGCLGTIGIGAGQMSRLDAARLAVAKAERTALPTAGSAAASDAFFPFADGLQILAEAGIAAVIQPGGSVRDADVIAAADAAGIAMVFTGMRHFRH